MSTSFSKIAAGSSVVEGRVMEMHFISCSSCRTEMILLEQLGLCHAPGMKTMIGEGDIVGCDWYWYL